MNEEHNQQEENCSQDQVSYPVEPIGDGEGASVLRDCPSTEPWTDLNGWLTKRWPIEIAQLRRGGVLDPEAVFQDIVIEFIEKSKTDSATWQNLGLRRWSRGKGAYRKQVRDSERFEPSPEDHPATAPHPGDALDSARFRENLELLLRDLCPAKRSVLAAHYFDGRTYKEISEDPAFGAMSVPALKSQLHRTREELLKRCIELFGSLQEARNHLGLGQGY